MGILDWKDDYNVNIEEINKQHKELLSIVREFHAAISKKKGEKELSKAILFLYDYVENHFKYEEDLLLAYHYPDYEKHKKLHDEFKETVLDFKKKFESRKDTLLVNDVLNTLLDWLIQHIKVSDKKYVYFLNSKGIN